MIPFGIFRQRFYAFFYKTFLETDVFDSCVNDISIPNNIWRIWSGKSFGDKKIQQTDILKFSKNTVEHYELSP